MRKIFSLFAYLQLIFYLLLIFSLFYFFDLPGFFKLIRLEKTLFSLKLSLITATIVTILSVSIAIPSGYVLSRFNIPLKRIIDAILELPLIVSPAALGAMILIFFNTPTGEILKNKGFDVTFTFAGIIVAQFSATAGIATRLLKSTFDEISKRYEEVAKTLGATPFKAFTTVTLPMAKRGIYASSILIWAKALGEFGATITVAGTMSMKTETLPIAIFMSLARANLEEAVVLILITLLLGVGCIIIFTNLFNRFEGV
jgi:molybdate transport system permease protein